MKKKLEKILLVDDSEADNFFNKRIINKAGVTEEVVVTTGGRDALAYLTTKVNGDYPSPELIFLDINMPGMSGWEFLDAYQQLEESQRKGVVVCMLTTSYAEQDQEKANKYNTVQAFSHKPLTKEHLMNLVQQHYPDYL